MSWVDIKNTVGGIDLVVEGIAAGDGIGIQCVIRSVRNRFLSAS
jgi:hypothetical protein